MERLLSIVVLLSVLAVAGVASATTISFQEIGVNSSNTVYAHFRGGINDDVCALAGYYQLRINGAATVNGFCVDPAWAPSDSAQTYNLRAIDPIIELKYARAAFLFSLAEAGTLAANQDLSSFNLSQYSLAKNGGYGGGLHDVDIQRPHHSPGPFHPHPHEHPAPVPEPATMLLLGSGLVWVAAFRRRTIK
jgi:hypothetical protein